MAFTPLKGFKPFKLSSYKPVADPIELVRDVDPITGAINQSPAAQTFMQAALPIAGGALLGPGGAAGGAYLGQRLFGPEDEGERKRRGVRAGVMAGGTHMIGQGIYDYYGGGTTPIPGTTPSAETMGGQAIQPSWQTEPLPPTYEIGSPSYQLTEPSPSLGYTPGEMAAPPPTKPTTPYTLPEPTLAPAPYPGPAGVGADMMLTPPATGGGMIAPTGREPGATPYSYMGRPSAPSGQPYSTNYSATTGGGGWDWGGTARRWGPIAALQGLSIWQQKEMAEEYQEAQQQSYEDYLNTINPPEDVKATQFEALRTGILRAAPAARSRRASAMAARGIRGKGAAAPVAETESDIQSAIDQARLSVYGQYNVPAAPPPVSYTPSTGQMALQQGTDLATILAMYNLYGGGR